MLIDFTEIPQANKGGGLQDTFELFSRDFLAEIGFEIIQDPDRGPDGKKDMIVREMRQGIAGNTKIDWLVSCKHFAHTGRSVSDNDEINITERVKGNKCNGFLGVYSTLPSSGLNDLLAKNKNEFESKIYDHEAIEKLILDHNNRQILLKRYFTKSYEKHKHLIVGPQEKKHSENLHEDDFATIVNDHEKLYATHLTEEDILRISLTAIILIEIEKIKEKYYNEKGWDAKLTILNELYKFSDYTNYKVAQSTYSFLYSISEQSRLAMPTEIAISIFSSTLDFYPYNVSSDQHEQIFELGHTCANTAFNLIYDAAFYLENYQILMYGLTILKYIYLKAKVKGIEKLIEKIESVYNDIERYLNPTSEFLTTASELVALFKSNRETGNLAFPALPIALHKKLYPTG